MTLATTENEPYFALLRASKLSMALFDDAANLDACKHSHIVETEPFYDTFNPRAQCKRSRAEVGSFAELADAANAATAEPEEGSPAAPAEDPEPQIHADMWPSTGRGFLVAYTTRYTKSSTRRISPSTFLTS
ncbi:uncharacterized protein SCHCODRAFT_02527533 [Schizophyllum commune H4-8]|nr:uncharacterized protein SCHCODRAFT_02527533 [Schizophyllum commune H4-8]KAI5898965.1 hypothetical protein SCHCODRAFT_02527533 [Schizophyllum commune H4-8]